MGASKRLHILVADDDPEALAAMARLLRHNAHTVYTARTASAARELAAAHRCDLLVSDIGLPDSNGLELMRDLRARHGLKGIAVTGSNEPRDETAALNAGFAKYLLKPVLYSDLLAAIDEVMR